MASLLLDQTFSMPPPAASPNSSESCYLVLSLLASSPAVPAHDKLRVLARTAAAANSARRAVRAVVRKQGVQLLPAALRAVQHTPAATVTERVPGIAWCASRLSPAALSGLAPAVLSLGMLPEPAVSALLAAGFSPSAQALTAAARQRLPSLHVWVVDHASKLPVLEETICVGKGAPECVPKMQRHLPHLPTTANELVALLHIAFNQPQPAAADALVGHILDNGARLLTQLREKQQAQEEQHTAQRDKAAARATSAAAGPPAKKPRGRAAKNTKAQTAAAAAAEAAAACAMLQAMHDSELVQMQARHEEDRAQLALRAKWQRAVLASTPVLQELMLTASVRSHVALLQRLLALEDAKAVRADTVAALSIQALSMAFAHAGVLPLLMALPAAQRLPPQTCHELLQTAVERRFAADALTDLGQLPGVTQAAVAAAAAAALQQGDDALSQRICALPQLADISPQQLRELLQLALEMGCHSTVELLCSSTVNAAHALSAGAVLGLLRASVQARAAAPILHLSSLLGAQRLSVGAVVTLLEEAVRQQAPACIERLCSRLPQAKHVDAGECGRLLLAAMAAGGLPRHGDYEAFNALCRGLADAAEDLPYETTMALLQAAMSQSTLEQVTTTHHPQLKVTVGEHPTLVRLFALDGCAELDEDDVAQLAQQAVALRRHSFLLCLSALLAAEDVESDVIEGMMRAAIAAHNHVGLFILATNYIASELEPPEVLSLLRLALRVNGSYRHLAYDAPDAERSVCPVEQLCRLPAAKGLTAAEVAGELCAAARLPYGPRLMRPLLELPGAQGLDAAAAASVLRACMEQRNSANILQDILLDISPLSSALDEAAVLAELDIAARSRIQPRNAPTRTEELLQELLQIVRVMRNTGG